MTFEGNARFAGGTDDNVRGEGQLQAGWTITMDEFGAVDATEELLYNRLDFAYQDLINKNEDFLDTEHPYANWLICTKSKLTMQPAFAKISLTYEGVYKDEDVVKYSIEAGVSEEPIDTHSKFAEFAGKPSEMSKDLGYVPATGAVFSSTNDLTATFQEFVRIGGQDGSDENSFFGVEAYLHPDIIFVETRTLGEGFSQGDIDDLVGDLGKTYSELAIPDELQNADGTTSDFPDFLPDGFDNANFLLINATYEKKGKGGILKRKWRMSGEYGWNEFIYANGGYDSIGDASGTTDQYGQGANYPSELNDNRIKKAGDFQDTEDFPLNAEISFKNDGSGESSYVYEVTAGEGLQLAKDFFIKNKNHHLSYMSPKRATITGLEGGREQVSLSFSGIPAEGDWECQVDVSTQIEPIDTHPNFYEENISQSPIIAGTDLSPQNGAQFAQNGGFLKFSTFVPEDMESQADWRNMLDDSEIIQGHMPNIMKGVQSYAEVGMEWKETKFFDNVQNAINEVKKIAKIAEPQSDDPSPPRVRSSIRGTGNRTWLIVSVSFEMVGSHADSGFKVGMTYRLSGDRGWNQDIYEET